MSRTATATRRRAMSKSAATSPAASHAPTQPSAAAAAITIRVSAARGRATRTRKDATTKTAGRSAPHRAVRTTPRATRAPPRSLTARGMTARARTARVAVTRPPATATRTSAPCPCAVTGRIASRAREPRRIAHGTGSRACVRIRNAASSSRRATTAPRRVRPLAIRFWIAPSACARPGADTR